MSLFPLNKESNLVNVFLYSDNSLQSALSCTSMCVTLTKSIERNHENACFCEVHQLNGELNWFVELYKWHARKLTYSLLQNRFNYLFTSKTSRFYEKIYSVLIIAAQFTSNRTSIRGIIYVNISVFSRNHVIKMSSGIHRYRQSI